MIGPGAKPNHNNTVTNENKKETDALADFDTREINVLKDVESKETERKDSMSSSTFGKDIIQQKGKNALI